MYGYKKNLFNKLKQDVAHGKKRTTLKYDFHPLQPYMTTSPYSKTTFKIIPLKKGEKPPSFATEDENDLQIRHDKLFPEFLTSMFESKEARDHENKVKYQNSLNQLGNGIARENKNNNVEKEQINPITKVYTTVTNNVNSYKSHIPITVGYASESEEYVSATAYVPKINDDFETEEYFSGTEYKPESQETYHNTKYIPLQKHTPKIERHLQVTNYVSIKENHFNRPTTSKTIDTPKETSLELTSESSDDSNDSGQFQSHIKNAVSFNKSSEDALSGDISDVPEEQAIAELLDEIDLNQILKEISPNLTISTKSSLQSLLKDSTKSRFVISNTTTEIPEFENNDNNNNNLRNFYIQNHLKGDNDSVLKSLYLSDTEEQDKTNQYIGDVGTVNGKKYERTKQKTPPLKKNSVSRTCKECNKMYNLVPKSQLYNIISQVLRAANINKNTDT